MKVLVTGSSGFAGRWLLRDLNAAGHEIVTDRPSGQRIDITDRSAVEALLHGSRPDLIIHLAAVAFAPDAEADTWRAVRVNVGGTAVLVHSARRLYRPPAIVVVSSAEVYGAQEATNQPIKETAATLPSRAYGLSKLGQESVALAMAKSSDLRIAILRPFNHTGPGQRRDFAIPAFAARIVAARASGRPTVRVGNIDVHRDIGDVRDTVRAYRLVGEGLVDGRIETGGRFNVATGVPVRIGTVVERLAALAGCAIAAQVDPALLRADDPPMMIGDATVLRQRTGWSPEIPLERTLQDVLADVERGWPSPGHEAES